MSVPVISIMMPAYNAELFIGRAIDSILTQSFTAWELILVDDGSTDRTAEIAKRYSTDERIRVVRQANKGEAAARNTALGLMRGEFVAFLDADDEYLPEHLEMMVSHLWKHPEHSGVYSDGYYITAEGRRIKKLSERRRTPRTGRVFDEIARGSNLVEPPLCVLLRRAPIERFGLKFDERIVIGPDWDFFLKFADVGSFGYVDQPTCLYRVHTSNISRRTDLQRRRLERAKCRINAIGMASFSRCALDVRVSVFQDLLIQGLRDAPDRQRDVIMGSAFRELPKIEQARLLRLMASTAILCESNQAVVEEWIQRSFSYGEWDFRGWLVGGLYRLNPSLCRYALRLRRISQEDGMTRDPLADLHEDRLAAMQKA